MVKDVVLDVRVRHGRADNNLPVPPGVVEGEGVVQDVQARGGVGIELNIPAVDVVVKDVVDDGNVVALVDVNPVVVVLVIGLGGGPPVFARRIAADVVDQVVRDQDVIVRDGV